MVYKFKKINLKAIFYKSSNKKMLLLKTCSKYDS